MGIKKPANLIVDDIPENKLRSMIFLFDGLSITLK